MCDEVVPMKTATLFSHGPAEKKAENGSYYNGLYICIPFRTEPICFI